MRFVDGNTGLILVLRLTIVVTLAQARAGDSMLGSRLTWVSRSMSHGFERQRGGARTASVGNTALATYEVVFPSSDQQQIAVPAELAESEQAKDLEREQSCDSSVQDQRLFAVGMRFDSGHPAGNAGEAQGTEHSRQGQP